MNSLGTIQRLLASTTVVFLAVLVCFRFFSDILMDPGAFLFGAEGDGLKNYYTVAYQVVHGQGMHFKGMLFPFGDHLMFADGQPLLVKLLSTIIPPGADSGAQVIAIMNLLMIGSLVITAWAVHRLLINNRVNPWFAVPFALTVAFLSPQMARFTGHYALGYTFFIPVLWLLLDVQQTSRWPWPWALMVAGVVLMFGFIHPYYIFIFMVFAGAMFAWELLTDRPKHVKAVFSRMFMLLAPMILFLLYQKHVELYADRPRFPGGIHGFMATFQSIFVPVADPLNHLFNSYFFRIFIPTSWEGHAYIGMVASFTAFASVYPLYRRIRSRGWKVLTHPVLPASLKRAFIPGIITLLFAMGLFHRLGLEWLSEYITPIKQFRSLGRVAWIFFYVFSIWVVYHLYVMFRYLRHSGRMVSYHAFLIIGLSAFLWMLDAIVNIKSNKERMIAAPKGKEVFSASLREIWEEDFDVNGHTAILPLPLSLNGSEKIGLENGPNALRHAMHASFSTGLPIIGGAMSRTSLRVTEQTAQLVADPLFPSPILDSLKSEKLLILWAYEKLSPNEMELMRHAETVYDNEEYRVSSITVDSLRKLRSSIRRTALRTTLDAKSGYVTPQNAALADVLLWGDDAHVVERDAFFLSLEEGSNQVFSFWLKVDPRTELLSNVQVEPNAGEPRVIRCGKHPDMLDGWLLVSDTLRPPCQVRLTYRKGVMSRLQLRQVGEDIHHTEGDVHFYNNIPISESD